MSTEPITPPLSGSFEVNGVMAMQTLAAQVARSLVSGDVLLLSGPLGSGKTTFVQGLGRALGVTEPVTSPTFTIVSTYALPEAGTLTELVHVDLYRLPGVAASGDPALADVLAFPTTPGRVTVIEWAERLGGESWPEARRLTFAHGATATERVVTIGT